MLEVRLEGRKTGRLFSMVGRDQDEKSHKSNGELGKHDTDADGLTLFYEHLPCDAVSEDKKELLPHSQSCRSSYLFRVRASE